MRACLGSLVMVVGLDLECRTIENLTLSHGCMHRLVRANRVTHYLREVPCLKVYLQVWELSFKFFIYEHIF